MHPKLRLKHLRPAALLIAAAFLLPPALASAATYTPGQHVQVREGDVWSPATVLAREGRRYHIHYDNSDSSSDEWVSPDRIRDIAGSPAPADSTPTPPPAAPETVAPPQPAPTPPPPASPSANPWTLGQSVEVKFGGNWRKATVARIQGMWTQVYYPPFDQMREWVEPYRIRQLGSTEDTLGFAHWNPTVGPDDPPPHAAPPTAPPQRNNHASPFTIPDQGVLGLSLTAPDRSTARELSLTAPSKSATLTPPPQAPSAAPAEIPLQIQALSLLLDPTSRFAVAATRSDHNDQNDPLTIQRIDLSTKSASAMFDLAPQLHILAISPDGSRLLTRSDRFFGSTQWRVDLWSLQGDQPKPILSFRPYKTSSADADAVTWAQFLNNSRILTASQSNELVQWKLPTDDSPATPTVLYIAKGGGQTPARFCPGGYVLLPTGERIVVLKADDGAVLASVPALGAKAIAALAPTADRIAQVGQSRLLVTKLDGQSLADIGLPPALSDISAVDWLTPDLLLLNRQYLFDLPHHALIWNYPDIGRDSSDLQSNRLWYLAQDDTRRHQHLASATLPDAAAAGAAANATDAKVLAQSGTKITLAIADALPSQLRQQVIDHLTQQLTDAGMIVADNQPISLKVRIVESEPRTIIYRVFGRGEEQAIVRPKRIQLGFFTSDSDDPVWKADSLTSGAPMMIRLRRGETAQDAVDQATRPDYPWLLTATLPKVILAATNPDDLGTSQLGGMGATHMRRPRPVRPPAQTPPTQKEPVVLSN